MKKNLDITKPRYRELILQVPWPFVISRFHCNCFNEVSHYLIVSLLRILRVSCTIKTIIVLSKMISVEEHLLGGYQHETIESLALSLQLFGLPLILANHKASSLSGFLPI